MISIIVCSKHKSISNKLAENIRLTIGVPYELIVIDNSSNRYSLFSAYNEGAKQSRYKTLCFMHEDICFHSTDWGVHALKLTADRNIGVAGVAGSTFKTKTPSPWWISNFASFPGFLRYHLIQHSSRGVIKNSTYHPNRRRPYDEVVVLDGVWFCCRKDVWLTHQFDEAVFNGFHFYDLDFSLSVWKTGLKNVVTYEVLLEHYSSGSMNREWFQAARIFQNKWESQLPASVFDLSKEQIAAMELAAIKNHLQNTLNINCSFTLDWWGYWLAYISREPFRAEGYGYIVRYFKNLVKLCIRKS